MEASSSPSTTPLAVAVAVVSGLVAAAVTPVTAARHSAIKLDEAGVTIAGDSNLKPPHAVARIVTVTAVAYTRAPKHNLALPVAVLAQPTFACYGGADKTAT